VAWVFVLSLAFAAVTQAAYNETLASQRLLPLVAGAYSEFPEVCVFTTFDGGQITKKVTTQCGSNPEDTGSLCFAYIGVAPADRAIFIVYRGTTNYFQLYQEILNTAVHPKVPTAIGGTMNKYFYNIYQALYRELRPALVELNRKYPGFKIWVTGHSLGGALATITGGELVGVEGIPATRIVLITFGQPRIGDGDYASRIARLLPDAYRVINSKDIVVSIPPILQSYWHTNNEVWYKNGMSESGSPHAICPAESQGCFNSIPPGELAVADHFFYFGVNVGAYGLAGCFARFLFG